MPLDADTQAVIDLLKSLNAKDFSELSVEAARTMAISPPPEQPTAVANVRDLRMAVNGGEITLRLYQPDNASERGTLVYFHGGGWVVGNLESHDETCRILCAQSGANVVSVDYRLAPEHPFPTPFEDCYESVRWVHANASELGLDATRLAVGGDSAGGNLAAAVALKARDGNAPKIACQLLVYPVTNASFDTASYAENAEGYFLTKRAMEWFWDHYAPTAELRGQAYASPLRAESLAQLPPALVQTAQYDPLRDEGEAYASALREAGNAVSQTRYDGVIHGFFGMQASIAKARTAQTQASEFLRQHLT